MNLNSDNTGGHSGDPQKEDGWTAFFSGTPSVSSDFFAEATNEQPTQGSSMTTFKTPRTIIATPKAPAAIGTYSQAVNVNGTVYLSGQIGLNPATGEMVDGIDAQITQVFDNLKALAEAAGGSLNHIVKLNVFLTDLGNFAKVNETMAKYFSKPFPARAAVGVAALPRGAQVEADAVLVL
jgi:reactive intermediate/imine deaminase